VNKNKHHVGFDHCASRAAYLTNKERHNRDMKSCIFPMSSCPEIHKVELIRDDEWASVQF